MVDGLIGTIGAVASIGGIVVALLAIQPWLVPLLFLAGLPILAGVMKAGQAMFGFHMRMTAVARARNYLYRLLTEKDPAKEVRAFGLSDYLTGRHTVLYERHMAELRKTTRKRFRIAIISTLGLSAALGAGMAGLLALWHQVGTCQLRPDHRRGRHVYLSSRQPPRADRRDDADPGGTGDRAGGGERVG